MKTIRRKPSVRSAKKDLTEVVYEGLCQEITSGKLRPGELLSRRQIAQRYGVSYTPVIEAMVRLQSTGLVEAESKQMARVPQVSLDSIRNHYVLREALETQAIRLACERATPDDIADLYRRAEEVDRRRHQRDTAQRQADSAGLLVHWQFHRRIAELSGCPTLVAELERAHLLRRLQATWFHVSPTPAPRRYHSLLIDLVAKRDVAAADAAMRHHVRNGLETILQAYGLTMNP